MYFVNLVSTCISIMMGRGHPSSQYESVVRVCSMFLYFVCMFVCLNTSEVEGRVSKSLKVLFRY